MIKYAIAGLLVCAAVPAIIWSSGLPSTPIGHQGQVSPIAAIVIVPVVPQREIRTFAWFISNPSAIEPARVQCHDGVDAIQAECQNADRASLHVFNQQLRAQYLGTGR